MNQVANLQEINKLAARGAVFYISHSGGKDSQAQYAAILKVVPASQIRVIHADLGTVEHLDVKDHINANISHELHIAKAFHKDGKPADFFSLVRQRRAMLDAKGSFDAPAFPSSAARFCTSDLKTGPIWREIRQGGHSLVVNCVGIRGQESKSRGKKVAQRGTLNLNNKNNNSVREAYDWWPIADWSIDQVWAEIAEAGQVPHHAYAAGNDRLSCAFCIFGSVTDLRNAAAERPDLLKAFGELEIEVRTTMFADATLAQRIA
jgi:DNA sulfur modification protein DndC